jgi:hypothetical protein
MEMNPVDHWAFSQIIEKWRKNLADSQIELTATQVLAGLPPGLHERVCLR